MKKCISIVLMFTILLCMTACGDKNRQEQTDAGSSVAGITEEDTAEKDIQQKENTNILVAYFSCTGNTKPLAEYAAEYLNADLYEIKAEIPYSSEDLDYNTSDSRANKEQNDTSARPAVSGQVENMEKYDMVVLAYPIWWGEAPRIISTFLESYDFKGKTIVPFCTSHSSGIGSSDKNLHSLVDSGTEWKDGRRFAAGTTDGEITEWLDGMGIKPFAEENAANEPILRNCFLIK